jgi:hypothetical protein
MVSRKSCLDLPFLCENRAMGVLLVAAILASGVGQAKDDWSVVETTLARKATVRDGVARVNYPRRDLDVRVGDVNIAAGFGMTTWVAFQRMSKHSGDYAMAMGDFVATDAEAPAAQRALLNGGMELSAVHNHLLGEQPGLVYMHFSGQGETAKLASAFLTALKTTGAPLEAPPAPDLTGAPDWSSVEQALGRKGTNNGRVYNVSIPRADKIFEDGEEVHALNGAASSVNFQWLGNWRVALTSDLVLTKDEVRPVVHAMHRNGITITALHNHMLEDEPRTFHMHVWAIGAPATLAKAMAEALDLTDSKK